MGGYDSKQALCTAERLDTAVNSWMPLPDLHSERVALCAVTVQGQVLALMCSHQPQTNTLSKAVVWHGDPPEYVVCLCKYLSFME